MIADRQEMEDIKTLIGEPALLEQLAEEAAELGKAALKLARILRKENPTPVSEDLARMNVLEEYTDVVHCAMGLGLEPNKEQIEQKTKRWQERIRMQRNSKL